MQIGGVQPNNVTYILALKACAGSASLNNGKRIHVQVCESCLEPGLSLLNTFIDMYAKSGDIDSACIVFNKMSQKDITTWNVMIAAYVEEGYVFEAIASFILMKERGYRPDEITLSIMLKAGTHITTVEHGHYAHSLLMHSSVTLDAFISSLLIDIYMKHGNHIDAWHMFDQLHEKSNVVWNVMLAGCTENGMPEKSCGLVRQFLLEGHLLDKTTIINIIKASLHEHVRAIHVYVLEMGFLSDLSISNTILEVYVNCGSLEHASKALAHMTTQDVVSWNMVIVASIQQGQGESTLSLFGQMLHEHIRPNHVTFSSILKVCANLPALECGMEIHKLVNTSACESFVSVGSALVDMYAKCGTIDDAFRVFNNMEERQSVAWTALIAGCALQGLCKEAIELFEKMQDEDVKPDTVTFVTILSACSRAGLLEEGWHYFIMMNMMCFDALTPDHVACMVDLLARAGQLQQAKSLIMDMPIASDEVVWMVLLDACRIHENIDMGRYAFRCVLKCNPSCHQAYVVLSNIYALGGMLGEAIKLREETKIC